jgi:hypothetical protein
MHKKLLTRHQVGGSSYCCFHYLYYLSKKKKKSALAHMAVGKGRKKQYSVPKVNRNCWGLVEREGGVCY